MDEAAGAKVVHVTSATALSIDDAHNVPKDPSVKKSYDWNESTTLGSGASAYSRRTDNLNKNVGLRREVGNILKSQMFDMMIGFVILLNSITVGIEAEQSVKGETTPILSALEHVFLSIYIIELGARIFVDRLKAFEDGWVKFDTLLVSVGIITNWVMAPLAGSIDLGPVMILRVGRLFRLVRAVRLLLVFRELWMLARGLIHSLPIMLYTMLMILMILYIFSCVALEIISKHSALDSNAPEDEDFKKQVEKYFPDLLKTMLSLVQFVSADSMASVYLPLVERDGYLMLYFGSVILVVSVVLTNLITAVVVNSALAAAAEDAEYQRKKDKQQKKKMVRTLKGIFETIDDDNSGKITLAELMNVTKEERAKFETLIPLNDPKELFKVLDLDSSGHVELDEFLDGCLRLSTGEVSIPLIQMQRVLFEVAGNLDANQATLNGVTTSQNILMKMLEDTQTQVSQIKQLLESASDSLVVVNKGSNDMPVWAQKMMSRVSLGIESIHDMLGQTLQTPVPNGSFAKPLENKSGKSQDRAELLSACADAEVTIVFQPGPIGITSEESYVQEVKVGGQAHRLGVALGWMIKAVDGQRCANFNDELIRRGSGNKAYEITFATQETPAWARHLSEQLVREVELMKSSLYERLRKISPSDAASCLNEKHLLVMPDVPAPKPPNGVLNEDSSRNASGRPLNGCSLMPRVCVQQGVIATAESSMSSK